MLFVSIKYLCWNNNFWVRFPFQSCSQKSFVTYRVVIVWLNIHTFSHFPPHNLFHFKSFLFVCLYLYYFPVLIIFSVFDGIWVGFFSERLMLFLCWANLYIMGFFLFVFFKAFVPKKKHIIRITRLYQRKKNSFFS